MRTKLSLAWPFAPTLNPTDEGPLLNALACSALITRDAFPTRRV
jgi:hypothetical protein